MDRMAYVEVHSKSEAFKTGFIKCLYDLRSDDGNRDGGRSIADCPEQRAGYEAALRCRRPSFASPASFDVDARQAA